MSGRTIAQVAEDAGMDLQEFLEEYDLPADMPGDTTESAAYNCISVSKMAEIYDMDFDTIKKVLNFPNSVNKDTAWGVAIGQVKHSLGRCKAKSRRSKQATKNRVREEIKIQ